MAQEIDPTLPLNAVAVIDLSHIMPFDETSVIEDEVAMLVQDFYDPDGVNRDCGAVLLKQLKDACKEYDENRQDKDKLKVAEGNVSMLIHSLRGVAATAGAKQLAAATSVWSKMWKLENAEKEKAEKLEGAQLDALLSELKLQEEVHGVVDHGGAGIVQLDALLQASRIEFERRRLKAE